MEWDKIAGAIITAVGGFYMYDRKAVQDRLAKLEDELSQTITDIKVVEVKFSELKEDIQEIKSAQKSILEILTRK